MIVSEIKTGNILALANVPDFDPNHFNKFEISSQRNRHYLMFMNQVQHLR